MRRVDYARYKHQLVLYLVSIYQPCTPEELRDLARSGKIDAFKGLKDEEFEDIISRSEKEGFLLKTKDGRLHLTYLGFRLIAKRRLAFVRDMNRLFYLKDAV